jgi:DNA recombination protein RmuC
MTLSDFLLEFAYPLTLTGVFVAGVVVSWLVTFLVLRARVSEMHVNNSHLLSRLDEVKAEALAHSQQATRKQEELARLQASYASLQAASAQKAQGMQEQLELLQENKAVLLKEFEALSHKILDEKARSFKQTNAESINHLLAPVQKELGEFKQRVDTVHSEDIKQRAELKAELKQLQSLNVAITEQADKLTNALAGNKKMQGGWGEMILESVLDKAGLRLGHDYQREVALSGVTLAGEAGKFRPDAVVYLPHNKHLVIDAKTSFNAYQIYVNSENELERQQALKAHVEAIRARLNELADKTYFRLEGLNSPEVVIMFIPIESAYVEALKADEQLFVGALERNVLIATPTTLLTSLNIVKQLWRFEDQNKHALELASRAEKLYAKLVSFVESMQKVGRQIDTAKDTYDKAFAQLYTGRGNLIKQVAEFKDLGVAVQKELPEQLAEQARLELPNVKGALDESADEAENEAANEAEPDLYSSNNPPNNPSEKTA